ncbi:MAG: hypothetical protein HY751_05800 [Nitrospinae bacterium]|nr:hypothetical protein [Nitrospinota bacterium]
MNDRIDALYKKIRELEKELEEAITRAGEELSYHLEERRIRFERSALELHRRLKKPLLKFIGEASVSHALTAPVVYSLIFPMVLLDIFVTVYQWICFPVYGIKKVPRSDFIAVDRHHLAYLNILEKVNCVYCGYGNGLLSYAREVAARTENYWCPIKHATRIKSPHSQYHKFARYGDAEGYRELIGKPAPKAGENGENNGA